MALRYSVLGYKIYNKASSKLLARLRLCLPRVTAGGAAGIVQLHCLTFFRQQVPLQTIALSMDECVPISSAAWPAGLPMVAEVTRKVGLRWKTRWQMRWRRRSTRAVWQPNTPLHHSKDDECWTKHKLHQGCLAAEPPEPLIAWLTAALWPGRQHGLLPLVCAVCMCPCMRALVTM